MIVYSHRFQGVLQHMVVELGLDLTLSDDNSPISLGENEQMLTDLAATMDIEFRKERVGKDTVYIFMKPR
ncbi:MAG: hypothetical protein AAF264_07355 [Pseudomonadota bacterium]